MSKSNRRKRSGGELLKKVKPVWEKSGTYILGVLFFLLTCLSSAETVKPVALCLVAAAVVLGALRWKKVSSELVKPPLLALTAYVAMGGVSMFYAMSGKFALHEFLKLLIGWAVAALIAAFADREHPGERGAAVLEGACALAGLVSIDLLSTRVISTPVLWILGLFTRDYQDLTVVEEGVRMTSLYMNPNVFAGCMGLGVLLSLGLAVTEEKRRGFHTVCLYVNSLAFVLAFSMGATGVIVVSFLVYLALEGRERRPRALVLMAETLGLAAVGAGLISATSFTAWTGFRVVPLACLGLGSAGLWALDRFVGRRIAGALRGHERAVPVVIVCLLAAVAAYGAAAVNVTGGAALEAGEGLRRAAYPEPGAYTLTAESRGELLVTVESQNQRDTMMHTSSVLYEGAADQAAFQVPEDSLVVYFNLYAPAGAQVEELSYAGEAGSGEVPLGYKLLPGFIANRLQGLFANENAIQRTVFFADGMKLFRRGPLFGMGLGSFETALKSVQSFYYETKYVHNHYIQTLLETGLVGLALYVGLLGSCVWAVWRSRKRVPLAPALGAAVVFMAGHAMAEVVFSYYAYLPLAFGVVGLLSVSCAEPVPALEKRGAVKGGLTAGVLGLAAAFLVLLVGNMSAQSLLGSPGVTLEDLTRGAELDKFEWADYMLSYVSSVTGQEVEGEIREQADAYAERLGELDSNTIPVYLAEYYFSTGRTEEGLAMTKKYVEYLSSDPAAWRLAFHVLEQYAQDTEEFRAGVKELSELLAAWNGENMGTIELDEGSAAFLQRMGAL